VARKIWESYDDSITKVKSIPFHYDKLVRKADLEKKRKHNKLNWLKKMYNEKGESTDIDNKNHELINWSHHLDFDEYLDNWYTLAVSNI
jgi:hypothetical protein